MLKLMWSPAANATAPLEPLENARDQAHFSFLAACKDPLCSDKKCGLILENDEKRETLKSAKSRRKLQVSSMWGSVSLIGRLIMTGQDIRFFDVVCCNQFDGCISDVKCAYGICPYAYGTCICSVQISYAYGICTCSLRISTAAGGTAAGEALSNICHMHMRYEYTKCI